MPPDLRLPDLLNRILVPCGLLLAPLAALHAAEPKAPPTVPPASETREGLTAYDDARHRAVHYSTILLPLH